MEKADANGFINVHWPSKNVPYRGIFHTRVAESTIAEQQFLKALLEESKLTIALRSKDALGLRRPSARAPPRAAAPPQPRPRTSRRRSLSAIRDSGIYDVDQYRPHKRGEDREEMKARLAHVMAFGDSGQQQGAPPPRLPPPAPRLPTAQQTWHDLVAQIRERAEWLAEMEYLGAAAPHREIVSEQIAQRVRALDALGLDCARSPGASTASGFSTTRSREPTHESSASSNRSGGAVPRSTRALRPNARDENVAAYGQLSPLQYSPRRRV